jgi:hypothetical protein
MLARLAEMMRPLARHTSPFDVGRPPGGVEGDRGQRAMIALLDWRLTPTQGAASGSEIAVGEPGSLHLVKRPENGWRRTDGGPGLSGA